MTLPELLAIGLAVALTPPTVSDNALCGRDSPIKLNAIMLKN